MAQKPIAMEQLKQLLQLQADGVGIREMARRTGISRNSVRKYLSLLDASSAGDETTIDDKTLAGKAYSNDSIVHDAHRLQQLIQHFEYAKIELAKTGVTRQLLHQEYLQQYPDG